LIACGCVPLLIVAGTLEGFVSPSALPGGLKLLIGLTTGMLLYTYLLLGGRGTDNRIEDGNES
ncbi:MAG: stage II sporulation protein M, partial [Thermomicrobia bacterium]|nr:stage II sporulation protein M [Thermomicrobia bacterium]